MQTLWKKKTPLHPTFAPINNSLAQDWFLLPHELQLQRAHVKTLHAAGILTDDEWAALNRGLDTIEQRYADRPCPESDAEDLHTWIEMELATSVGEVAGKIHTARSRNDQVATLLKLYVIAAGRQLTEKLARLTRVCCLRAKDWSDLVFPLQTHCQFAAPGSVGFWTLRYAAAFDRVRSHLDLCAGQWKRYCPLGAGAVAGSSIPIDRAIQATELHFAQPARNALDATTTRDECLDLLALAAQAALHLQSLATDVIAFSQTPFGWTIYPAAFGTGSSMMPNKTNPDAMELLRGEANTVLSAHSQSLLLLKGLPSGYNRDLQCIKPIVRDAVDKLSDLCELAVAFLQELEFDEQRIGESLSLGAIDATFRMEQAVLAGTPLRDAHHAVASDVQSARPLPHAAPDPTPPDATAYRTLGSASPAETRRIANQWLTDLDSPSP